MAKMFSIPANCITTKRGIHLVILIPGRRDTRETPRAFGKCTIVDLRFGNAKKVPNLCEYAARNHLRQKKKSELFTFDFSKSIV